MTSCADQRRPSFWTAGVILLQVALLSAVLWGLAIDRPALTSNAAIGLALTLLPTLLERRLGVTVAEPLVAWVGFAAALHAAGLVLGLYAPPSRFDLLTHLVSGSVVVAGAIAILRSWDHRSTALHLSIPVSVSVVLATVMAGGVLWEALEFAVSSGTGGIQQSLEDTMTDLLANLAGGMVAIVIWPPSAWGQDRKPPIAFGSDSD